MNGHRSTDRRYRADSVAWGHIQFGIGNCLLLVALLAFAAPARSQINLRIHPTIHRPEDSVLTAALLRSLDSFIGRKELPARSNPHVLPEDLLCTSLLLDELKQAERSSWFRDTGFYHCHVTNIVATGPAEFLVQLSYMGVKDSVPYLCASFRMLAKRQGNRFFFASPLKELTRNWKRKTFSGHTFYYSHTLPDEQARTCVRTMRRYDAKLKGGSRPGIYYYSSSLPEALAIVGVDYKLEYNGHNSLTLSTTAQDTELVVNVYHRTRPLFDPHDLWHARVRSAMPVAAIHKPVDEGCAFLYGGSWGLTWRQIREAFMNRYPSPERVDWLELYEDNNDFSSDRTKPLLVAYMINALIVQQLEKAKGFDAVARLLTCGRYEATNTAYFKRLEELTGINRANFNTRIVKLINESKL